MNGSRIFFTAFAALLALVGLFAAAASHDYLQFFGLMLFGFGVLFALSCVKRHFDEAEATRH
jgi:hypothetical protein